MRMFWQRPAVGPVSRQVTDLLIKERGMSLGDGWKLRMAEESGMFAGRPVTFFRVFSPAAARAAGITVQRYRDLDPLPELYAGHAERDGALILNGRTTR